MHMLKYKFSQSFSLIIAVFISFFLSSNWAYAQTAKDENAQKDSVLLVQQTEGKKLIRKADSARVSDSLQALVIQAEIDNLNATDIKKSELLQRKLDSLKQAQIEQDARINKQVDSLRAITVGVPVIFHNDTLLSLYAKLGPFSARDRAKRIVEKLNIIAANRLFEAEQIKVFEGEESYDILYNEMIIMSITARDAFFVDKPREQLANEYADKLTNAIITYQDSTGPITIIMQLFKLILVLLFLFYLIKYMNRFFTLINKNLIQKGGKYINGIKFKNYEFLSVERETQLIRWLLKVVKWIIILLLVYLSLPLIFSIFPSTQGLAETLFDLILNPIKDFVSAVVGYISELITIIVIVVIARYIVQFIGFLAREVESEKLVIHNFYPEWARPTYTLLKIVIYAFSFIVIFPLLPGSDSPAFKGVSVFLGVLISLGSSSAISNIIAGLVITYMRAFKIGDRVKIGDITGDVLGKTMLVTHMRTVKNEDITIPNATVLNGSTINYSSSAKTLGLILNTTITIGYDVPWKKVNELLLAAALKTNHIKKDPSPFVLQTSLDDFYVSYQINAYTENSGQASRIYSDLHANIQDAFNEAGVEIMSPHYRAARDGNLSTMPPEYLPKDYKTPGFNLTKNK